MLLSLVVHHPRTLTGRNRCCMKITLSWKLWDNLGLIDATQSRLLRADNRGPGRHRGGLLLVASSILMTWAFQEFSHLGGELFSSDAMFGIMFGDVFVTMNATGLDAQQHYLLIWWNSSQVSLFCFSWRWRAVGLMKTPFNCLYSL